MTIENHNLVTPHTPLTNTRFIPLSKWNNYHDYPTVGGLRWMVFHKETNGIGCCLKRVGKRILIDEAAFFAWVASEPSMNTL